MSREAQSNGWHSRGYLPHLKRAGATYFVTFRLADSLPREAREQMAYRLRAQFAAAEERDAEITDEAARRAAQRVEFVRMEAWLDAGAGSCLLGEPGAAELTAGALRHFAGVRYGLHAWVVMPNHVHVLVEPMGEYLLGDIVGSWKQFVARRVGQWRKQAETGPFWQRESYDRWVRDDTERTRIVAYIERNPVKAGLCASPEAWRWGSAHEGGRSGAGGAAGAVDCS